LTICFYSLFFINKHLEENMRRVVDFFIVFFFFLIDIKLYAQGSITNVWVNNGEDKVTQDELRAYNGADVTSSVWDGDTVHLFGARNEVVSFNIILEAATSDVYNVNVSLNQLSDGSGSTIDYTYATGEGLFDWTNREIELFYVRYLEIKGLSQMSYESYYDERHVPERMRRPCDSAGHAEEGTLWTDRPDHNKMYPDIAVPLELRPDFTISAGTNQSIWVDIYIPKTASNATYTGNIVISEGISDTIIVPVELYVYDFGLPDMPNSKTMMVIGYSNINERYMDVAWPNHNTPEDSLSILIRQRHMQLSHRHKISVIDANEDGSGGNRYRPHDYWLPALDGSLFTSEYGYDGPGYGTGNNVFSIALYGRWVGFLRGDNPTQVYEYADSFVSWFAENSPETEYFLYLIDEPSGEEALSEMAGWCYLIKNNPGDGSEIPIFVTINLLRVEEDYADLIDISGTTFGFGVTEVWDEAVGNVLVTPGKKFYFYNGHRPCGGSFSTEDDGVALRVLPWAQYKKSISRWFFWESTYYDNYQGGMGETNVFRNAQTFGNYSGDDEVDGETGWGYSNGDGVMIYPGTDHLFPSESYDLPGPIASLRLKHWRRGIQDVDYLAMAESIDPVATYAIIDSVVPKVLWEYGCAEDWDPTWLRTDISWSTDPDVWEAARKDLAEIIDGAGGDFDILDNFTIKQNYPNPFNSITKIKFHIPISGNVNLSLYNNLGQKVETLIDGYIDNRYYEVEYDGSILPNGIYFFRLEFANASRTIKSVLIR
jgi:hypothetical protein